MLTIHIATRKSPLALAQAEEVKARLIAAWPGLEAVLVPMTTTGDNIQDRTLTDAGGKGLFTKELEEALLDGRADIAVHSMKDMQTALPEGLAIGCMLPREDARDMLIGKNIRSVADLPKGAVVGTSSLRRGAQLLMLRPDLKVVPLRGNVGTRLSKLEKGEVAATMLAVAGLKRLGIFPPPPLRGRIEVGGAPWEILSAGVPSSLTLPLKGGGDIYYLPLALNEFIPAVAQGAIGIECRKEDADIMRLLAPLSHAETESAVFCERAFLKILDGSCKTPIAGYASIENGQLHFRGLIAKPDGSAHHSIAASGKASEAEKIGEEAGRALLAKAGRGFI